MKKYPKVISFWVSSDDFAELESIANRFEITVSEVVRKAINAGLNIGLSKNEEF